MKYKELTIKSLGLTRDLLLQKLVNEHIHLNEYAHQLFKTDSFNNQPKKGDTIKIVEVALEDIGLRTGGTFAEIEVAMDKLNLTHCPLEFAPYIRLTYTDQKSSMIKSINRHPPGAIKIFSKPVLENEDFPRGFYIRNIDGLLWLRGYKCSLDYQWDSKDRMIFQTKNSLE